MGRRFKPTLKTVISIYLPVDLVTRIDEITDNRSKFIEDIINENMDILEGERLKYELALLKAEYHKLENKIKRLEQLQAQLKKSDTEKIIEHIGEVDEE